MTGLLTGATSQALIYGERTDAIVTFMTLYLISVREKYNKKTICILKLAILSIIQNKTIKCDPGSQTQSYGFFFY